MTSTPGSDATTFDIEIDGGVAHLRLNRPDAYNSMTREFWSELPAAVRELDATGTVRALVISSTGKHFCAGMDLAVFTSGGDAAGIGSDKETGRLRARRDSRRGRSRCSSSGRHGHRTGEFAQDSAAVQPAAAKANGACRRHPPPTPNRGQILA